MYFYYFVFHHINRTLQSISKSVLHQDAGHFLLHIFLLGYFSLHDDDDNGDLLMNSGNSNSVLFIQIIFI